MRLVAGVCWGRHAIPRAICLQGDLGAGGGVPAEQPTGKATPGRRRARGAGGSAQRPKSGRAGALPMLASAPLPLRMPGTEGDAGARDTRPGVQELKSWGPPGSAQQQQGQGWPMPGMDILRAIWPGPGGPGQGPPAPAPRPLLQPQGSWAAHQMQAPTAPPQGAQVATLLPSLFSHIFLCHVRYVCRSPIRSAC